LTPLVVKRRPKEKTLDGTQEEGVNNTEKEHHSPSESLIDRDSILRMNKK